MVDLLVTPLSLAIIIHALIVPLLIPTTATAAHLYNSGTIFHEAGIDHSLTHYVVCTVFCSLNAILGVLRNKFARFRGQQKKQNVENNPSKP